MKNKNIDSLSHFINFLFKCPTHSKEQAEVDITWVEENGFPCCGKCGDDMKLVRDEKTIWSPF